MTTDQVYLDRARYVGPKSVLACKMITRVTHPVSGRYSSKKLSTSHHVVFQQRRADNTLIHAMLNTGGESTIKDADKPSLPFLQQACRNEGVYRGLCVAGGP